MSGPIRIAMVIQTYLPRLGGAERQVAALAPLLQAQGFEIEVFTRRYAGMETYEIVRGVPVHRIAVFGPKPVASLLYTAGSLKALTTYRPHLIHAHELLSPTTTALAAKRLLRLPVVAKVLRGGALGDIAKLNQKSTGKRRMVAMSRQVDAFVVISHEIDLELREVGVPDSRRVFIPNGVDTQRFQPMEDKRSIRIALGLPNDNLIVLYGGRLVPEKRVATLVESWPVIRARFPDALLVIAGSGEEEDRLKAAAQTGVRLVGAVDNVVPYLQAADVFVLPSATEGLSNALLEAMAAGLPVVATAVGGAPDLIDHQQNGWLIVPDDPQALQDGIMALLANEDLRHGFGERARERVEQHYSLDATANRLGELYRRLLRERPSQ